MVLINYLPFSFPSQSYYYIIIPSAEDLYNHIHLKNNGGSNSVRSAQKKTNEENHNELNISFKT